MPGRHLFKLKAKSSNGVLPHHHHWPQPQPTFTCLVMLPRTAHCTVFARQILDEACVTEAMASATSWRMEVYRNWGRGGSGINMQHNSHMDVGIFLRHRYTRWCVPHDIMITSGNHQGGHRLKTAPGRQGQRTSPASTGDLGVDLKATYRSLELKGM